ncbi:hypothetical protein BJ322DRAFT_1209843 [Thelephora terrestris]|uniref:Uncharacterized protein n=1 Tax=Thelephora terrestris TaxID=56493 RepID=A0A9P6HJR6_9AGAM|nr:hypothetical protein BJ322DRAFT_1209843 [Thelephora terrestris]
MSLAQDPHPDVEHWLGNHHRVSETRDGGEIHVFAIEQGNVYASESKKTYEVVIAIGPISLKFVIVVDFENKSFSVSAYGKFPFLPMFKIGYGSGSFDKGVTFKFDMQVIKGTFTFYIKDGWLWLHYDISVLGKHFKGDLKLIPLPV